MINVTVAAQIFIDGVAHDIGTIYAVDDEVEDLVALLHILSYVAEDEIEGFEYDEDNRFDDHYPDIILESIDCDDPDLNEIMGKCFVSHGDEDFDAMLRFLNEVMLIEGLECDDMDAILAYIDAFGAHYVSQEHFAQAYDGCYRSTDDFYEEYCEHWGVVDEIPPHLFPYFDCSAYGEANLHHDFTIVEDRGGNVHIFNKNA